MRTRKIVIIGCFMLAIAGIYYFRHLQYDITRVQADTLYTYFHKLQDSIRAKHYPVNMDSLKKEVHDSMLTLRIYGRLMVLENSVKAYKK